MKVLIISHNACSTYQNMGKTLVSLFTGFEKQEPCQLYVYPSLPNVGLMNSCFRITDREALKSILIRKSIGCEVFAEAYQGNMIDNSIDEKIYSNQSNNMPIKRLLRDAIWKASNWYSAQLRAWLDREKPTCIFLAPGYAKFIYDIALKISKERRIPIITYICDDYYFLDKPETLIGRIQLSRLQKKIRQTMMNTKLLIVISDEIGRRYSEEFSVRSETIMTGSSFSVMDTPPIIENVRGLSYFGNIGLNREKSLAQIGRALDLINKERKTNYYLQVHTGTQSLKVLAAFDGIQSIKMCGFLVGEEYKRAFFDADCLVHVEAFDEESMDLVKGSISTKIADALASGIPMLAYGPKGIASMTHLMGNSCAFCANNDEELVTALYQILTDHDKRKQVSETALQVARKYHVAETNSNRLRSMIEQIQETT